MPLHLEQISCVEEQAMLSNLFIYVTRFVSFYDNTDTEEKNINEMNRERKII